jgi:hypothetical protein
MYEWPSKGRERWNLLLPRHKGTTIGQEIEKIANQIPDRPLAKNHSHWPSLVKLALATATRPVPRPAPDFWPPLFLRPQTMPIRVGGSILREANILRGKYFWDAQLSLFLPGSSENLIRNNLARSCSHRHILWARVFVPTYTYMRACGLPKAYSFKFFLNYTNS